MKLASIYLETLSAIGTFLLTAALGLGSLNSVIFMIGITMIIQSITLRRY